MKNAATAETTIHIIFDKKFKCQKKNMNNTGIVSPSYKRKLYVLQQSRLIVCNFKRKTYEHSD